jgi:hypothetical protein
MPGVVRIVDQRIAAVQGPIQVLFLAALAISFGVVDAAGIFSFASRRVDAGVLAVRGWGPARVGFKAVLESILPCALGAATGFLVATGAIAWLGPDGSFEPSARASALVGSVVATLAVIALVGVVSALSFVRHHEPRVGASRFVFFLPWELLAFFGAYLMARRLHSTGGVWAPRLASGCVRLFRCSSPRRGDPRRRLLTVACPAPWGRGTRCGVVPGGATARSSRLAVLFLVAASLARRSSAASEP